MENKNTITLITGASSGIGFELARCFARDNYHVVMIAHHQSKLQEAAQKIQQEFPTVPVNTISCDLSKDNAPEQVFKQVQQQGWQVEVLVNNAGFGEYGLFAESDLQKELAMIHLNVIALVHLTKLFLPQMLSRNSGKILQVGSVASFMPSPLQSVYGATKAFILFFGEALQEELKEFNVTVTILCPPATDTNFFRVAGAQDSKIAQGNLATPEEVAAVGYEALIKGDARAVPTFKAKLEVAASNILPDSILAKAMHKQSEEKKTKKKTTAEKDDSTKKEKTTTVTAEPAAKPKKETASRKKKVE